MSNVISQDEWNALDRAERNLQAAIDQMALNGSIPMDQHSAVKAEQANDEHTAQFPTTTRPESQSASDAYRAQVKASANRARFSRVWGGK